MVDRCTQGRRIRLPNASVRHSRRATSLRREINFWMDNVAPDDGSKDGAIQLAYLNAQF